MSNAEERVSTDGWHAPERVVIRPRKGWRSPDLREVWHYRELLWILALRDISVRYKQTFLGATWAVLQPLFTMVVFTVISKVGKISTGGIPPHLFYFSGALPWLLFANALSSASNSVVGNQGLITKVYFPRLVIPISAILTAAVDFAFAFATLLALMAWYRVMPGPQIALVPVFALLALGAALGVGLWLAALNVEYRDVRHVIPFLTQLWLFCTPILYPSSAVQSSWKQTLLGLNPMSGIVEGFRWCIFGEPTPGPMLGLSVGATLIALVSGLFFFHRAEQTFADRV
jgi:lipopolysaccharide transport system permease protein